MKLSNKPAAKLASASALTREADPTLLAKNDLAPLVNGRGLAAGKSRFATSKRSHRTFQNYGAGTAASPGLGGLCSPQSPFEIIQFGSGVLSHIKRTLFVTGRDRGSLLSENIRGSNGNCNR